MSKFICHAELPYYDHGKNDYKFEQMINEILREAFCLKIKSIAMAVLGSGVLGHPVKNFIKALQNSVKKLEAQGSCTITEIIVCEYNQTTFNEATKIWNA
jgi:O-acetyl-ADP-ribose deacetylase (regulator of RNase III)